MKKCGNKSRRIFCAGMLALIAALVFAGAGAAAEQAAGTILVTQPAYVGMQFYVYRPVGIPVNWYATFDGYPVWKNADGIWLYGSASGSSLIPTNYVVGSVVPSLVGLTTYVTGISAVPVQTAPVTAQVAVQTAPVQAASVQVMTAQAVTAQAMAAQAVMTQPAAVQTVSVSAPVQVQTLNPVIAPQPLNIVPLQSVGVAAPVAVAAPVVTPAVVMGVGSTAVLATPRWLVNPSFLTLGDWKGSVDRVGLLFKPVVPIAWKGRNPQVVYAWTGSHWYQMAASEGERPGDVLRNHLYNLTRLVNQNGKWDWAEPNVSLLAHKSAEWGYRWMGTVNPLPSSYYSNE